MQETPRYRVQWICSQLVNKTELLCIKSQYKAIVLIQKDKCQISCEEVLEFEVGVEKHTEKMKASMTYWKHSLCLQLTVDADERDSRER